MQKKKTKLQRSKDNPRSRYWRNKADEAWRQRVLERDRHKCAVCGAEGNGNLNVHHLFPRSRPDTRHIIPNGITLCPRHHKWSRECSPHKGPVGFFVWLMRERWSTWAWLELSVVEPEGFKADFRYQYNRLKDEGNNETN